MWPEESVQARLFCSGPSTAASCQSSTHVETTHLLTGEHRHPKIASVFALAEDHVLTSRQAADRWRSGIHVDATLQRVS